MADGFLSAIIYSLIAIAIWFPVVQMRRTTQGALMVILNHLLLFGASSIIWIFSVKWLVSTLLSDPVMYGEFWRSSILFRSGAALFIYTAIILAYYLMISLESISRKEIREANLENMLRETELMMLRSQINPHFLFNSLNSISSLTVTEPEKAREMVIKLSEFMRYALSRKEDRSVPLEKELENLRLYLDIEKVRFGDRIEFNENAGKEALGIEIPNMILQPLYENAIKHGVYESISKVSIELTAKREAGGIRIIITNNYDPDNIPAHSTGTGLRNIRRRLELYYGGKASIDTRKENGIFTAELYFPDRYRQINVNE